MKTYLLAAAGVIFLSVIVSLLVPEGKLHKSITFIMRLVCIAVLIQPITGIFGIKDDDASKPTDHWFDYEYVCEVYSEHQSGELEKLIEKEFETPVNCAVAVGYFEGQFKVTEVEVILAENNVKLIDEIYAYLDGLNYINITVYAQST